MEIPTRKEIGRFSHGYMTGLVAASVIVLIGSIHISLGWPFFMMYVISIGLASGVISTYVMALMDKDDIPREIAMYSEETNDHP